MSFDVLILDSGEWLLTRETEALPWHILVYAERGDPRNELHLRLPQQGAARSGEFAFRRFWVDGKVRWCVDLPDDPRSTRKGECQLLLRFTAPDGQELWVEHVGNRGLGDLSEGEMLRLREQAAKRSLSLV